MQTKLVVHSIPGACAVAQTSRTALYAALQSGELRAVKRGRRTLIFDDELRRWLKTLPPLTMEPMSSPAVHKRRRAGEHAKKSAKSRYEDAVARLVAEDRAVNYLGKLSPPVAALVALKVEKFLATRWEEEQDDMILRGDPREVVPITNRDIKLLARALANVPPDVRSDPSAEQHIIRLLADFSPDWAWWIAHRVAEWMTWAERMKKSVETSAN